MKRMPHLLLILLCVVLVRFIAGQQSPNVKLDSQQKGDGAITGRVIGDDGQPMAGVQIVARRIGYKRASGNSASSDEDGNFKLTGLSPGAYTLWAIAPAYVVAGDSSWSEIHRIGENVTINMVKGGVITGRVTDETGEPLVGVRVIADRVSDLETNTMISRIGMPGNMGGVTDDRGVYRIYGLQPGVYVVGIRAGDYHSPDAIQIIRDAPTYYPSATRDTAAEVDVRSGEEVSGIDIRHRGERGRIVSGAIAGESESAQPFNYVQVTLKGSEIGYFESTADVPGNSRGFAIFGVPDGDYELRAYRAGDGEVTASSVPRRISVRGANVTGVELKLMNHGSIAGRVVIEPANPATRCASNAGDSGNHAAGQGQSATRRQPAVEEIILKADREEADHRAPIAPSWRFENLRGIAPGEKGEFNLNNLEPGRYRITADLPDTGWYIRALKLPAAAPVRTPDGKAKTGAVASLSAIAIKPGEKLSGLEVVVAEGGAMLNGRIVPAKEGMKLPARLQVHLIPAEAPDADNLLRYAQGNIRGDGTFEFKHIAPGKYLLLARQAAEKEAGEKQSRPIAWDAAERSKLRREAEAAKNEIELQPCGRVNHYVLRVNR